MRAIGRAVNTDQAPLLCLLLTSHCGAGFLTDHQPAEVLGQAGGGGWSWVVGLGIPGLKDEGGFKAKGATKVKTLVNANQTTLKYHFSPTG